MLSRSAAPLAASGAGVEGAELMAAAEGVATALASLANTGICVEMMLAKKPMGGGAEGVEGAEGDEGVGMGLATAGRDGTLLAVMSAMLVKEGRTSWFRPEEAGRLPKSRGTVMSLVS